MISVLLTPVTSPVCVVTVLSADCSGASDLTMSPEERVPMRRSSTREQDRRSGGTCFLLAASDYNCPTDGGLRKTGKLVHNPIHVCDLLNNFFSTGVTV